MGMTELLKERHHAEEVLGRKFNLRASRLGSRAVASGLIRRWRSSLKVRHIG
jgi:hypothetical protein